MRDLRKNLREYIDLRRALGFRLRKHERRLSEFITFLKQGAPTMSLPN
jgi:hypothetical protein